MTDRPWYLLGYRIVDLDELWVEIGAESIYARAAATWVERAIHADEDVLIWRVNFHTVNYGCETCGWDTCGVQYLALPEGSERILEKTAELTITPGKFIEECVAILREPSL